MAVADRLTVEAAPALAQDGGAIYGLWRSQIGRPRDELTAITVWSGNNPPVPSLEAALGTVDGITAVASDRLTPTLRPSTPEPPRRQGNYAFRWFDTPLIHWDEFLQLCADAWPGFEASYDSQVIGLWRGLDAPPRMVRSLLLTRRPDLAMWERSKIPQGAAETTVREKLSRRYDLCDDTVVYTTTLLNAADRADTARWT